jgi:hypothetical protein
LRCKQESAEEKYAGKKFFLHIKKGISIKKHPYFYLLTKKNGKRYISPHIFYVIPQKEGFLRCDSTMRQFLKTMISLTL